jgi:hypothetical protein
VLPEQAYGPGSLACGRASAGWRGAGVGARAWRLGCLILAPGGGCIPAPAVTAKCAAAAAVCPVVAAGHRDSRRRRSSLKRFPL